MRRLLGILRHYWHTVRHLRPVQIWGRVWFRLYRPRPDMSPPPAVREYGESLQPLPLRAPSMLGPSQFHFLNREGTVDEPEDWNDPEKPKLWLYHLHYFDDLTAREAGNRRDWHRNLIRRWVRENPPGGGVGWEPYPTSLRIVNWIMWTLGDEENDLPEPAVHSLAVQSRWLERRLEHHLQGNHLLANAKALIFAGLFFEGGEARRLNGKGRKLLEREIDEQLLDDQGHFERSPMYHALVLEDLLDLINVLRCYGREVPQRWTRAASSMRAWLNVMRHPDGEIPFFNDAAFGIALPPERLDRYAERLGVSRDIGNGVRRPTHDLRDTGYVRVKAGAAVAFFDLAPVGPDHLPAHAHADTLSFELSLGDRRLFVNTGTSTYEAGERRSWERGTPAHNTAVVDNEDSSEVWAGFRVARRARVTKRKVEPSEYAVRVVGEHDGYRRLEGRLTHRREWCIERKTMTLVDRVEGEGRHHLDVWLHVHPAWNVVRDQRDRVHITRPKWPGHCNVRFEGGGKLRMESSYYAPEFGRVEPMDSLQYRTTGEPPFEVRTYFTWKKAAEEAGR